MSRCLDPSHHHSKVTGRCLEHKAAAQATYRKKNREKLRLKQIGYHAARKEKYHERVIPALRSWLLSPPIREADEP